MSTATLSPNAMPSASAHQDFLRVLPAVRSHANFVFRHYDFAAREEMVAESTAAAFVSFVELKKKGRDAAQFPSCLAVFAALHSKCDRHVGGRSSSKDVLSRKAQMRKGFRVEGLQNGGQSCAMPFVDRRTPIPDQVAFRVDFPIFLAKLSERDRRMALMLAQGWAAKEVARVHGISPPRLTQLRQEWLARWNCFHGE